MNGSKGSKEIDGFTIFCIAAFASMFIFVFAINPSIQNQHTSTIVNVTITDREPPASENYNGYVYLSDHQRYMIQNHTEFWKTRVNSYCFVEMMYYPSNDQYRIGQVYNCSEVM